MEKSKYYYNTKFSSEVIKKAHDQFLTKFHNKKNIKKPQNLSIKYENEKWKFDSLNEFFAEYPKSTGYNFHHIIDNCSIYISDNIEINTYVIITLPNRGDIESVFNVFEENFEQSKIEVIPQPIKVFLGHGNSEQWRDLKDHLHDQHGFDVVAYEVGPRAGLSVKEVLESMLNESSIAFLILTGEDIDAYGEEHARENVIHELGLFQGRLGFKRAIVLLEKDVHEFSNILGLNQLRFSKGNIKETFGDVLATIKREFEPENN